MEKLAFFESKWHIENKNRNKNNNNIKLESLETAGGEHDPSEYTESSIPIYVNEEETCTRNRFFTNKFHLMMEAAMVRCSMTLSF